MNVNSIVFGYAEPALRPFLSSGGPDEIAFATLTYITYWVLALGLIACLAAALYGLETWHPWQKEIGHDFDGDFGHSEQAWASGLWSGHPHSAD